ncbi:hypothetical protein CERSUDRAFT_74631 [Gelatoporia subvermispora B]|uniref:Uncharacterized protein n=1 Tax=Ceriporiopsis subvermispora (strain B) TaxID=914234 RepID=M2RBL0_CERS8|nr:hypothetical protein CERSUDRAFT_74631 [Gelatoporia subvermispora B]
MCLAGRPGLTAVHNSCCDKESVAEGRSARPTPADAPRGLPLLQRRAPAFPPRRTTRRERNVWRNILAGRPRAWHPTLGFRVSDALRAGQGGVDEYEGEGVAAACLGVGRAPSVSTTSRPACVRRQSKAEGFCCSFSRLSTRHPYTSHIPLVVPDCWPPTSCPHPTAASLGGFMSSRCARPTPADARRGAAPPLIFTNASTCIPPATHPPFDVRTLDGATPRWADTSPSRRPSGLRVFSAGGLSGRAALPRRNLRCRGLVRMGTASTSAAQRGGEPSRVGTARLAAAPAILADPSRTSRRLVRRRCAAGSGARDCDVDRGAVRGVMGVSPRAGRCTARNRRWRGGGVLIQSWPSRHARPGGLILRPLARVSRDSRRRALCAVRIALVRGRRRLARPPVNASPGQRSSSGDAVGCDLRRSTGCRTQWRVPPQCHESPRRGLVPAAPARSAVPNRRPRSGSIFGGPASGVQTATGVDRPAGGDDGVVVLLPPSTQDETSCKDKVRRRLKGTRDAVVVAAAAAADDGRAVRHKPDDVEVEVVGKRPRRRLALRACLRAEFASVCGGGGGGGGASRGGGTVCVAATLPTLLLGSPGVQKQRRREWASHKQGLAMSVRA